MPDKSQRHHRPKHHCPCGVATHSAKTFAQHQKAHPEHAEKED